MKNTWTFLLILFPGLAFGLFAQSASGAFSLPDSLQRWVNVQDSIRVGIDSAWPPIEYYDDENHPHGLSVELLDYVSRVSGLKFCYPGKRTWTDVIQDLQDGKLDLLTGVAPATERESFLSYVPRHDSYPIMIYTSDRAGFVQELAVLAGRRVAFIRDYMVSSWVARDYPDIEQVFFDNAVDALQAVEDGDVFAFLEIAAVGGRVAWMHGIRGIKVSGVTEYGYDLAFGVRKDLPELAAVLDLVVGNMSSADRARISSACLEPELEQAFPRVWILSVLVVALMYLVHNGLLRRQVRQRTSELNKLNETLAREACELKQVRAKVQTSQLRYQEILNSTFDALLIHDDQGLILEINKRTSMLFGYTRDEMLGMRVWELSSGAAFNQEAVHERIQSAISNETDTFEWRCKRKDGSEFWGDVALRSSTIEGQQRLIATVRDVDQRRIALDELVTTRYMLEAALDQTPAGIIVIGDTGQVRYINQAAFDVCLLSEQEYHENSDTLPSLARECRYHDGEMPLPEEQPIQRALKEGIATRNERMMFQRHTGELRDLLVSAAPIRNLSGSIVAAIGVFMDVSDLMRTTEALRDSEIRYKQLFESASDAIFLMDGERFIDCNTRTLTLFACSRSDIIGQSPTEFSPEFQDDGSPSEELALEHIHAASEGLPQFFDWIHKRFNGELFHAEVSLSLIHTHGQDLVLAIVRDVSDRRRAEEERGKLATVVEQATEDVMLTDPDGVIQYVNPAFSRITGYSREEAIGRKPHFLKSGEHDQAFYRDLWNTVTSGSIWRGTLVNRRADGSRVTEDAIISPISDSNGSTIGYVAVKRDITERMQLEEQLRHAQKMEAVGQLAGGVAHDFNNLLQVIMGYTEMVLDEEDLTQPIHDHCSEVLQAGNRAKSLIQQLLAFSRRDALQLELLDLNQVLAGSARMVHRLIGTSIMLDFAPGSIGLVMADKGQVEQVVVNLCINARDAMPDGGSLRLETRSLYLSEEQAGRMADAVPGRYVQISVSDTGSGIPSSHIDRIFEPFFTTKGVNKGTGLGLATVYAIARRHGGFVTVESEEKKGSCFRLFFPEAESSEDGRENQDRDTSDSDELKGRGETILLAEDDPQVRKLACGILKQAGYSVIQAEDGEQATQHFVEHIDEIDLALLDVVMPKRNGRQVFEYIRERRPSMPILFASGFSFELQDGKELPNGGEHILVQKPYIRKDLLRRLRQMLDG